jgi:hypothetical protein
MGDFSLHKRKTSAYLPLNEPLSAVSRKFSAYFTLAGYSIRTRHYIQTREAPQNGTFCTYIQTPFWIYTIKWVIHKTRRRKNEAQFRRLRINAKLHGDSETRAIHKKLPQMCKGDRQSLNRSSLQKAV